MMKSGNETEELGLEHTLAQERDLVKGKIFIKKTQEVLAFSKGCDKIQIVG